MDMISYVDTTLSSLNIPIYWQLRPQAFPSITFTTYYSGTDTFGDGEEVATSHYIQIDVWSKNDYTALVDQVINLLKQAGFRKQPGDSDNFEEDTKIYHKILKFQYLEEESL